MGANTAIFSAIDEVLLRPLPVPHSDRLAAVYRFQPKTAKYLSTSYPDYEDLRHGARSFEAISAYVRLQFTLTVGGHAERVPVEAVTGNYFDMMKLAPVARAARGCARTTALLSMLSEDLWRSRFQGDAGISRPHHPAWRIGLSW